MNDSRNDLPKRGWLSVLANLIVCIAILIGAAAAIITINKTEPTAQQINTKRKSSALVETVEVQRGTYSPNLMVLGTVQPARQVVVSPRVRGQVLDVSSKFVPGEIVHKGDLLLQIDHADFANALSIRVSELQQVEASLEIEEGRQSLAKRELKLLGESIDETNRALVLRKPQYASIKSQVAAAQAAVERAKLELDRTGLVSPFDAQVLRRSVDVGSQVAPGDDLGQLVGIEEYWIMAAVPVRSLRWVQFPLEGNQGSAVKIRNPDAWGSAVSRDARVTRMMGTLDQETRLARVLITMPDPLGLKSDAPPLILDTLIKVEIEGRSIKDVIRLRREYVHDGETVWVMKDGKLEIRETEIAFRDSEHAYIREGIESGEEIVTTTLATVAEGIDLRKIGDAPSETDNPTLDPSEPTE